MTIQLPNKLIAIILMFAGTLTLMGCANNSSPPNYDLDTYTLGRSAVFTQRELINEQLKDSAEINTEVRDTLRYNYCDLVARNAIYVSRDNLPQQCKSLSEVRSLSRNESLSQNESLSEVRSLSQNESLSRNKSLSAQKSLNNKQRQCAYDYHICIKACPLRTDDCQPCINRAKKCLAPS